MERLRRRVSAVLKRFGLAAVVGGLAVNSVAHGAERALPPGAPVLVADGPGAEELLSLALKGNAAAQVSLGAFYEQRNSLTNAVRWFRQAAEAGRAEAQFKMGFFAATGQGGVAKDSEAAAGWFRKAAEQEVAGAQYNLAVCYERGVGVKQDRREACRWYLRSAKQGDTYAQKAVGVCYEKGQGVEKDLVEALAWYRLAAARENPDAVRLRDLLEPRLKPEERGKAVAKAESYSAEIFGMPLGEAAGASKPAPKVDFLE